MPEYDVRFAKKLLEAASAAATDGLETIEAQRTVLYLSLLASEIALKSLLERAGLPIATIKTRHLDLAGLLDWYG
jgi:hypothetical protein